MKKLNFFIMIMILLMISIIMFISCVTPISDSDSGDKPNNSSSSVISSEISSPASSTTSSEVSSVISSLPSSSSSITSSLTSSTASSVSSVVSSSIASTSSTTSSEVSSESSAISSIPSSSSSSSMASSSSALFIETFDNVPDGTNIRNDQTGLDNPLSFSSATISGTVTAGTVTSGSGAITINANRMAFTVPGLSSAVTPTLKVTIKNDNGSGGLVAGLSLAVGDTYTTSNPGVGISGMTAHALQPINNTAYQVIVIPLNTSFTGTNLIQFRGLVDGSSSPGLHIDKIEIDQSGASSSTSSSTGSSVSSTSSSVSSTTSTASSTSYSLPSSGSPIGYATANGGTNGGEGGDVKYASTGTELQSFINIYKSTNPEGRATRTSPRIIYITAAITVANSPDDVIYLKGSNDSEPYENISLIGVGTSGEFNGIGLKIERARNIIIQNIKFHHVLAETGDGDGLGINGPASNIWVDHCEFYNEIGDLDGDGTVGDSGDKDFYDALLDTKYEGAQYITYSHNIFHDSYKTSLMGYSASDARDWNITIYANYYYNCNSRLPMIRGGAVHILNNYYNNNGTIAGSGINLRCSGTSLIESNYFKDSTDVIGHFYDDPAGYWDLGPGTEDSNYYENVSWSPIAGDIYITAQSAGFLDTGTFAPGYTYSAMTAADVPAYVLANAGVGKL